jgi:hypothetical protein
MLLSVLLLPKMLPKMLLLASVLCMSVLLMNEMKALQNESFAAPL